MLITKEELSEFNNSSKLEWLISNGIGSFASSTVIGLNTRKYHGLLVGALMPPARRHLILSKVDESIIIGNEQYNLYTNKTIDSLSEGYKYQVEFKFDILPEFKYRILDIKLS